MLDVLPGRVARVIGCLILTAAAADAQPPTFATDIAPLVYSRCVECHRPDGDAPFSLITYDEVKRHRQQIVELTRSGQMPPWKPDAGSGRFLGERRLTAGEQALLARWVEAGAPEGRREATPAPPRVPAGWRHGAPDLVLQLPTYTLRADGGDVFRNFVVTVPGVGPRFVRAFEFRPGSRAVHHANIFVDRTPASRDLDAADPDAGYEGLILNSAEFPDGHFLGWTPGQAPPPAGSALAWRVDGGNDVVVQLHMQPTGRAETMAPQLGLYLTPDPPPSTPTVIRLGRQNLDIPAGAPAFEVSDSFVLPVDAQLLALQPHAHQRARKVSASADLPDGSRRTLIAISDWDFRWQDQYRVESPYWLPAGTRITADYTFDNSTANPRNPDRPPRRVEWGWRTSDEMADVWIQVATRTPADRAALLAAARRKMMIEEALGTELLITRQPEYVALRNDAGRLYMSLGRPADALRHFSEVTRLQPDSAPAWFNQALALERLGRGDAAEQGYTRALAIDPGYASARMALAAADAARGRFAEAAAAYREVLARAPNHAEAHCNLGRVLTAAHDAANASREFQAAIGVGQPSPDCLVSYAWLLAAHQDAGIRRPADAIVHAEAAVRLTSRLDAGALDALGVAYAAAGRFEDAVAAAEAALALAEQPPATIPPADIRERVALYRQRKAVIVPD